MEVTYATDELHRYQTWSWCGHYNNINKIYLTFKKCCVSILKMLKIIFKIVYNIFFFGL